MNVAELYGLTAWIDKEILEPNIVQKYQQLQTILKQNTQSGERKPFETQKDQLLTVLSQVKLQSLTNDQLAFLEKLDIAPYVGKTGVAAVEDILYKNAIDIATAAQKIREIVEKINNGINKANQIKTGLTGCIEIEKIGEEVILLRVTFTHKAEMSNISDFRKWGEIWYDIGRGISMIHDSAPESIRVVGAQKGSIVLELAVAYLVAKTTSKIILEALLVADRVLDLKKKAEEIRTMKLSNETIARDLDKEAESEKEKGKEEIGKKILADIGKKFENEGDKITALDKSVNNLVDFIEKGGEVDCIIPEKLEEVKGESATDYKDRIMQLRNNVEQIRLLDAKLRQIEHKKPE
jgi:hypothetical protein